MEKRASAVAHSWDKIAQQAEVPTPIIPQGTSIVKAFEEAHGELLILGAPGAGKTTLLLELTRELISRTGHRTYDPMPVIFNLSAWAERRPPLGLWLVDELNVRYDVPRKIGTEWIEADQVLPLLDGLDEVPVELREECVEQINVFRQEHGMLDMVVCCRVDVYEALNTRLRLLGAVCIQPLTSEQIEMYITRVGGQVMALRRILAVDDALRELAQSPLMLNIMVLACEGMSANALPTRCPDAEWQTDLFGAYVGRMFQRRSISQHYPRERAIKWLAWLANTLHHHTETIFFIEGMQPHWLSTRAQYRVYALAVGLVAGLACGIAWRLAWGLVNGLMFGMVNGLLFGIANGFAKGMAGGLSHGIIIGMLSGFVFGGLASLQHTVLRCILCYTGAIPWNYAHFLDYAVERIFLRKVGGGYIFVHRLLLEFFAALDT